MRRVYFEDELTYYVPVSETKKGVNVKCFRGKNKKRSFKVKKDIDYVSMISIFLAIVLVSVFLKPNSSKPYVGTEITKVNDDYIIKMDFPGIKETDIKVELDNKKLLVKAFRLKPMQMKCYSNSTLSKKFILTDTMDINNIVKHFDEGVLTLTVPTIAV